MNSSRLFGWNSKPERKENFSFKTRAAPRPISTALRDVISDAAFTQRLLGTNPKAQQPQPRLQPLELDLEVGGRNNLGEIDGHSNVAGRARSSDDAMILADELPKRYD